MVFFLPFFREMKKLESSVGRLAEEAIYSKWWYIEDKNDIICKIIETEERVQKLVNTYIQDSMEKEKEMAKKIRKLGEQP